MKIFLMITILFLAGCQNNPTSTENASNPSNDSLNVQPKKEMPVGNMAAEPGSILFETDKLLRLINVSDICHFESAEGNAPNTDIVGETSIMQAEISAKEAEDLIKLFYNKCHDGKLEKFSNDETFWAEGKYDLKGFFNIADAKNSYFTCLIYGGNKYAYYVLGNP